MNNKRFIKMISGILVFVMILCSIPITVTAAQYSGSCGYSMTWSLDTATGVLQLSGSENMDDYSAGTAPWYNYRSSIKTVDIGRNVWVIGKYAFYGCTGIETINYEGTGTRWRDVVLVKEGNDPLNAATIYFLGDPVNKEEFQKLRTQISNIGYEKITVTTYNSGSLGTTEKAKYNSEEINSLLSRMDTYDFSGLTMKDQAKVDSFVAEIKNEMLSLETYTYDEHLQKAIAEYESMDQSVYTDDTWSPYKAAYNSAKSLVNPTQEQINSTLENLVEMKNALKVVVYFRAKQGTDTVIDKENGYVFGLPASGIISLENYIEYAGGTVKYKTSSGGFGTGTTVNFIVDGETVETYEIIIFGDISGDGKNSSYDSSMLQSTINGETTIEEDTPFFYAADLNGDNEINTYDLAILEAGINGDAAISQLPVSDVKPTTSGTYKLSEAQATVKTHLSRNKAKEGDVVEVSVCISTNYPVGVVQLPVLFDKTCFELVNYSYGKSYLSFNSGSSIAGGSYVLNGNAELTDGFANTSDDAKWNTDEAKDKYGYAWITATYDSSKNETNNNLVIPQGEVFVTFRLKAKTDIENTEELVFVSPEWSLTENVNGGGFTIGFSSELNNKNPITFAKTGMKYEFVTTADVLAEGVTLNYTEIIVTKDNPTVQLVATVFPLETTDKSLTWTSDNDFVAKVDATGKVTFVKEGTAVITVKTAQGQTAQCVVTAGHECNPARFTEITGVEPDCIVAGSKPHYKCSCGKLYLDAEGKTLITASDIRIEPLNHPKESLIKTEATEPTHTQNGNIAYWTCSLCKKKFADENCTEQIITVLVSATGHDNMSNLSWKTDETCHWKECSCGEIVARDSHYFEWIYDVEPTCTSTGIKHEKCIVCDSERNHNTVAEKVAHKKTTYTAKDPTCMEEGHVTYYFCSTCNTYFLDSECTQVTELSATKLPTVDHSYGMWITSVSATCLESGERYKECIFNCGDKITEVVEATGHKYNQTIVSETCTEDGYTEYKCKNCEYSYTENIVEATGHKFTSYENPPTDTFPGERVYSCVKCNYTFTTGLEESEIGYRVRCFVSAYGDNTQETTMTLIQNGEVVYSCSEAGKYTYIDIYDVKPGVYTMKITRHGHITRSYEITIENEDYKHSDVTLYLLGDVTLDGKVNTLDVARANAHARGVSVLTGDPLLCADATADGRINTIDVSRINAHAKGTKKLW